MEKLIKLGALSLAFLVVGCASPGPDYQSPISDYEHQGVRLNAQIEHTPDGWAFTELTESSDDADVRLDTIEYIGPTDPTVLSGGADIKGCVAGLYGLTDGTCNDGKFTGARVNAANYVISPIFTPLIQTFGVFWAPSLAAQGDLDVFILPLFSVKEFQWGDYADAAEEAKETDNFAKRFPKAYDRYVSLKETISSYSLAELPESNVNEIKASIDNKWESTKSSLLREADRTIELAVRDDSGLVRGNIEDLTPEDLFTSSDEFAFNASSLKERLKRQSLNELGLKTVTVHDAQVSQDISDFEAYLDELETEFRKAKRHNEARLAEARQMRESDNEHNRQILAEAKKTLASTTLERDYKLSEWGVDFPNWSDLNTNLETPATTISADGDHSDATIDLVIESVDIDHQFSPSVSEQVNGLELSLDDDQLNIVNTTDDYITVHSVSLYYDDQVMTRSRKNSSSLYEIAPTSEKSTWLSDIFDVSDLQTEFSRMTAEKARNTNLIYGVSMRYTVSGSGHDATIKMVDGHNLYSLLQEEDGWR